MMRMTVSMLGLGLSAGCMTPSQGSDEGVRASLLAADGSARGSVRVSAAPRGLMVSVSAEGLPAGVHGIHIHGVGRCDGPDFTSAGPHWNPSNRKHGRDNPEGAHHGDLPNIDVGADGRGSLQFDVPSASLGELLDADGAAIVVHANADDYKTDPSGNSGGRIACGVITRG